MLKNEAGQWVEDDDKIGLLFKAYYDNLFRSEKRSVGGCKTEHGWGMVCPNKLRLLGKDVDSKEVKRAFFQMGSYKAPGIDGYPAIFY